MARGSLREGRMYENSVGTALISGALVGVVVITTFWVVPFVRYVALFAATSAIAFGYFHGGVPELVADISALLAQMVSKPTFAVGVAVGMLLVIISLENTR